MLKPTPPKIKGLIKLHKEHTPIRPIVNLCNSPAYNLGRFISKHLNSISYLLYSFSVKNSVQLINNLSDIPVNSNTRMCSFDISNMYTNIPIDKVPLSRHREISRTDNMSTEVKYLMPILHFHRHTVIALNMV
jgi:hypothetical protein